MIWGRASRGRLIYCLGWISGSGDSGAIGVAPFNSASKIPAKINAAPPRMRGPRCSLATIQEVIAAKTGSRLMRMAVWVGEVYCWDQVWAEKPKAVEPRAVTRTATISVGLECQWGRSRPVSDRNGMAMEARTAVVATWTTASAPTE